MLPTRQGSLRLFRLAGIDVYLHLTWFLLLLYGISIRSKEFSSHVWNALEYVALFGIVLTHEFGHALACRQVGGKADQIILWPLGGVAYVAPPQRPGAVLWSIAAGPLVNVVLVPILSIFWFAASNAGLDETIPNLYQFIRTVWIMNCVLLFFNLLPIYPLDGGQILRALLWFLFGRAQSLMIAVVIGFFGVAALAIFAVLLWTTSAFNSIWLAVVAGFMLLNCLSGLMQARFLVRIAKLPHRAGFACPSCKQPPVVGQVWRCARCFKPFDTFENSAVCPNCGAGFPTTQCLDCGTASPISQWFTSPPPPPPRPYS
jgi:Zn-dependent protease